MPLYLDNNTWLRFWTTFITTTWYIYICIYIFIIIYIICTNVKKGGRGNDCTKKPSLKMRLHGNGPHDKIANQEDIKNIEPMMKKSVAQLFRVARVYVLLKHTPPFNILCNTCRSKNRKTIIYQKCKPFFCFVNPINPFFLVCSFFRQFTSKTWNALGKKIH